MYQSVRLLYEMKAKRTFHITKLQEHGFDLKFLYLCSYIFCL